MKNPQSGRKSWVADFRSGATNCEMRIEVE